jgi:signal transduction histidine kinase
LDGERMPQPMTVQDERGAAPDLGAIGIALVYLLAYWGLDWGSFIFPTKTLNIAPWNAPVAASLILVFLNGWRWAPMLFVGAFSSNVLVRHLAAPLVPTLVADLAEALIYAMAACAMRGPLRVRADLRSFRDILIFIAVTVSATALMAAAYVGVFWSSGLIATSDLPAFTLEYWVGDMIGITVVAPAFLINRHRLFVSTAFKALLKWEVAVQVGSVALSLWIMFFWQDPIIGPLFYPLFIPLVWVAARFGLPGVTLVLLLMQVGLMGTVEMLGITVLVATKLQYLMLALSWTGLLLGAVISERERAQVSVARGEARLRSIIELAPDGIVITDEAGNVELANRLFETIYGTSQHAIIGRSIVSLLPLAPTSESQEIVLRRADGHEIPAEVSAATIQIGGRNTSVIAVRDISVRKQAEARARQHREAVEQAFRGNLTEGLAGALAHELNQPLSAIASYTGAAQRILAATAQPPARALEQLSKVAAQAKRAGDIIRRLREFFRGTLLELQPVPVAEPVRGVLALLADEIGRVGASITVAVPDGLAVLADRLQMEQVLLNLIRNSLEALAEAPRGTRAIRISAHRDSGERVEIAIADTGSGIAPHVRERLFEPFVTASASGMGLGLTISRSIVQAHGGKLWAESRPSEGTVMHFTLLAADAAVSSEMDRAHG